MTRLLISFYKYVIEQLEQKVNTLKSKKSINLMMKTFVQYYIILEG